MTGNAVKERGSGRSFNWSIQTRPCKNSCVSKVCSWDAAWRERGHKVLLNRREIELWCGKGNRRAFFNRSWRRRCRAPLWCQSSDQRNTIATWDFKSARYSWKWVLQEYKCDRELLHGTFLLLSDSDWKIKPTGLPRDRLEGIHQWHIHSNSFLGHFCNFLLLRKPWVFTSSSLTATTEKKVIHLMSNQLSESWRKPLKKYPSGVGKI